MSKPLPTNDTFVLKKAHYRTLVCAWAKYFCPVLVFPVDSDFLDVEMELRIQCQPALKKLHSLEMISFFESTSSNICQYRRHRRTTL